MANFLTKDFLLNTKTARILFHDYAEKMYIYDYHCHIPPIEIAENKKYENITQLWLYGDHYKWRAMRANGIDERYITGDASDWEKFEKWAQTVPCCLRNPLYHWTHMELKKPFGITDKLLNADNAKEIYNTCSELLKTDDFSCRNIIRKANVAVICTTDDPIDTLEHHQKIKNDGFEVKVFPAWRSDKGMACENISELNAWIDKLQKVADVNITDYSSYLEAIQKRHDYFHENGCRISDHGIETAYAEEYTKNEINRIFDKIKTGKELDILEQLKFKSAMMFEFAIMDAESGWVQQFHLGALRNTNTRMFKVLGPDTGYDSIGDFELAKPLAKFLDRLDSTNKLPRTILYNLNPCENEVFATMIGSFQDSSFPGKIQWGPAWWFLDQIKGIETQINILSNMGLLSRFIGMTTDSRSFLSFSRHEYFRRILCNILGSDIENGLLPNDMGLIGKMIEDICFNNAKNYFMMTID